MKLDKKAFGFALAIFAAAVWLIIMGLSLLTGILDQTVQGVGALHPFFSYTWLGLVIMVIEHLIVGFIIGCVFACLYNKLLCKKTTTPEM